MSARSARFLPVVLMLQATLSFAASGPRLAIADSDSKSLTIIDATTGRITATVPLNDSPDQVLATADGKRIVAISRGPGKTTWLGDFRPTAKASATVIDAASMKPLQRVELGWSASDAQITGDGRLVILSPGVDAKAPEGKPSSLHAVDLTTGERSGSVEFERPAKGALVTGDQKQATVYFEGAPRAKRPTVVRFVDVATMQSSGEVAINAKTNAPAAFEGHDLIYLLDPPLSRAGTLYIVSSSQRKLVATHPVGQQAMIGGFDEATGRVFILSQSPNKGARGFNGHLDVFVNGQPVVPTRTIVDYPSVMTMTPDRKLMLVVGVNPEVIALDTLEPEPPIEKGGGAYEVYIAPDMKRAYLYSWSEQSCCTVDVFDLPARQKMKGFMIGSTGARIGQALTAIAASAGSYAAAKSAASSSGKSSFYYTVYTPKTAKAGRGMMVIRPDSKFAYALDPQTDYVTLIDGESGERLQGIKVGEGSRELVALRDSGTIAVVSSKAVTFIDTAANEKSGEVTFTGDLRGFETTADGAYGVALADGKMIVYDQRGKPVGEVSSVKKPAGWIFLP